jgi:hypothetical protein
MRPLCVFFLHRRHGYNPASVRVAGEFCGKDAQEPDSVQPIGFGKPGAAGHQYAGRSTT